MKTVKVELGGREYVVKARPMRDARGFRERLTAQLGGLVTALRQAESAEITNLQTVASLVDAIGLTAAGSIDMAADWLFDFAPELANDRKRIEAEAFDDEMLRAFLEALKLVYPFGGLENLLMSGLKAP